MTITTREPSWALTALALGQALLQALVSGFSSVRQLPSSPSEPRGQSDGGEALRPQARAAHGRLEGSAPDRKGQLRGGLDCPREAFSLRPVGLSWGPFLALGQGAGACPPPGLQDWGANSQQRSPAHPSPALPPLLLWPGLDHPKDQATPFRCIHEKFTFCRQLISSLEAINA